MSCYNLLIAIDESTTGSFLDIIAGVVSVSLLPSILSPDSDNRGVFDVPEIPAEGLVAVS